GARPESSLPRQWLEDSDGFASGPIPGLCDSLHRLSDLIVEHVGVSRRRLDAGVAERLLHELEVAGFAQELGGEVMPVVVEAEAGDASELVQALPIGMHATVGQRITLALDAPCVQARTASLTAIGENEFGMMPAERPQDLADGRRNRHRDWSTT